MPEKILINLLPQEFTKASQQQAKYYKLRLVAIISLMLIVFLTSTTIALRILQNRQVEAAKFTLEAAQTQVSQFKQTEVSLVVLKDRLNNISQIITTSSKQNAMYSLINSLIPPSISVDSITIDRTGNTVLSVSGREAAVLDDFISNLSDNSKNESKIASVEINNFSRSRESLYRLSIKIAAR